NRRQMTDPFGGNVYYWYDDLNRLLSVGQTLEDVDTTYEDHDAEYTYFKNGQLKKIQQKNGVSSNFTYDGFRLDTLTHKKIDGTVLNAYDYNYDNNGNITNRIENSSSKNFTYDNLNRVVNSDVQSQTFGYDVRGNRNSFTSENPSESTDATYEYNSRDQLVKVTTATGKIVTYKYNGDGLLSERTENGVTTRLYYDGGSVIAEGTVSGATAILKARYIRGIGLIARHDMNAENTYYLHNGHGDVVELRDATGDTRLNQYAYDIWGNPLTTSPESVAQPFRYSGEYWDNASSLQYLRSRWYDPSIGRFMGEDAYEGELTNPLSLNLYTYVSNNPLRYLDPTGHEQCEGAYSCRGDGYFITDESGFDTFINDSNLQARMNKNSDLWWGAYYTYNNCSSDSCRDDQQATMDVLHAENQSIRNNACSYVNCWNGQASFNSSGQIVQSVDGVAKEFKLTSGGIVECNCFTAGTKVLTIEGEKPIEEINVGDEVLSKNEETGEVAHKEVTATFNHETDEIYNIHVGGQIIESTFNHPFYVEDKGWTFVKDLKVGDLLVQNDGATLKIDNIELMQTHVTVYNMTVDEFHTYFVSDLGIWVHNTNGGCLDRSYLDNNMTKIENKPKELKDPNGNYAAIARSKGITTFNPNEWNKYIETWQNADGQRVGIHSVINKTTGHVISAKGFIVNPDGTRDYLDIK
uniref:polymorphic toxin-type HINT domain-containing protein n=1 Tax=Paenibacillus koleovorans TaxID=121608 RepID=UPI001FE48C33